MSLLIICFAQWSARRRRILVLALCASGTCGSEFADAAGGDPAVQLLIEHLGDPAEAPQAVEELVRKGEEAVAALKAQCERPKPLVTRGWAMVALGQIGGADALEYLRQMASDRQETDLVRIWAAASLVAAATTEDELARAAQLGIEFPALDRPIALRYQRLSSGSVEGDSVESLLALGKRIPQLEDVVNQRILALEMEQLLEPTFRSRDDQVRRTAAAYLATYGSSPLKAQETAEAVTRALQFDPGANQSPWDGGPLYVPAINWPQDAARQLVCTLIAWRLWAERRQRHQDERQIDRTLQSVNLARAAGYRASNRASSAQAWLDICHHFISSGDSKRTVIELPESD